MRILNQPIFQYAYLVNDLDAAAHRWVNLFGAGPFFTARHHLAEGYFRYRGDPTEADVSYAFGYCGPVQIQLIAQYDNKPSIFRDMFRQGEEGFHHVAILGTDFPNDKQHMLDNGLDLAVEMWSGADVVYFDARPQVGCFVEIHGTSPAVLAMFEGWKRAHDEWDGKTDSIRESVALPKQNKS